MTQSPPFSDTPMDVAVGADTSTELPRTNTSDQSILAPISAHARPSGLQRSGVSFALSASLPGAHTHSLFGHGLTADEAVHSVGHYGRDFLFGGQSVHLIFLAVQIPGPL